MPSDQARLGNAIVSALKGAGFYPSGAGAAEARSIAEWTVISGAILQELKDHMDIQLMAGDIKVDPGSLIDSSTSAPIAGVAINEAATLSGKLL
jgi:hypothetical protein